METNTNKHQTQTARKTTRRPRIWSTVGVQMCVLVFACLWWPPKCGPFLHVFCAFPIYKFIFPQERWNKASLAMIFMRDNLRNTNGNEATKKQKETRKAGAQSAKKWTMANINKRMMGTAKNFQNTISCVIKPNAKRLEYKLRTLSKLSLTNIFFACFKLLFKATTHCFRCFCAHIVSYADSYCLLIITNVFFIYCQLIHNMCLWNVIANMYYHNLQLINNSE